MKFKSELLFICVAAFTSCNTGKKHFSELLKSVDTAKIQLFTNNDTFFVLATSKEDIDIFKNIITGKQENIPVSQKTGRILFYSKGKLILDAAQFNTGIAYSSDNTLYKERMTYRAGIYYDFSDKKSHHVIDSANFSTEKKKDSLVRFVAKKAVFNNNEPFRIIHSSRGITDQSSAKDTSDCTGWTISNKALAKIIKDSRCISGTEWDLTFSVLPCVVEGQLIQNGNGFDFEVNGGSWFYLKSADTTLIFGNFKKEDEKYFIVKPAKE